MHGRDGTSRGYDPLTEAQHAERAFGRVRWGAAVLALVLGPLFPSLSTPGVLALGIGVALYNAVALRSSRRASTVAEHGAIAQAAFAGDLVALSVAMLLFSIDPQWTTYFLVPLVITGAGFRFGTRGTVAATLALAAAYLAVAVFRDVAFGYALEPQRAAFHVSVFILTAGLVDRVLRDAREVRAQREELIARLERRVAEDAAVAQATRIVATVPGARDVVPAVLEASRSVFRFDRATLFAIDEEAGEYRVIVRVGALDGAPPTPRLRVGAGLVGAALAADRPILVHDITADPRYVSGGTDEQRRSVIVLPLRVGGRAVAVLSLSRALPDAFGDDDLRLAETVAGLIAQVLENERLFADASEAEALRAMDKLKDEFLATVSHELRTPLTVVRGALELLARGNDTLPPRSRTLVDQANRHVMRLGRQVEDLLDLAQLQQAKIELSRELIAPAALLHEIATAHEVIAAQRSQRLVVAAAAAMRPLYVDRRRMHQIMGNLVANAIRYSPEGAEIRLRADVTDGEARLSVTDSGPGIPEPERDRVFEKFYRLPRTRDTVSGTGLGLAIAKTLTELHGGRIWVDAAPDGGSVFVVALPLDSAGSLSVAG